MWLGEQQEAIKFVSKNMIMVTNQLLALESLDDCFYIWHRGSVATINGPNSGRPHCSQQVS